MGTPVLLRDRQSLGLMTALAALVVVASVFSLWSGFYKQPSQSGLVRNLGSADASDASPVLPPVLVDESYQAAPVHGPVSDETVLGDQGGLRASIAPDASAYYEGESALLVDNARQADAAIIQALARRGLDRSRLAQVGSETRHTPEGVPYPFLRLVIIPQASEAENRRENPRENAEALAFAAALREGLKVWAPRARLSQEGDGLFFIMVDRLVTHSIRYGHAAASSSPANTIREAGQNPAPATLTIIIDDMGESVAAARKLAVLPYPVSFSIWPQSSYAAYSATLAYEKGRQVLIHQPMLPFRPERRAIEPGTLTPVMPRVDVARILRGNMDQVPYAVGLNNHMGSQFTSDGVAIRVFCEELFRLRPDFMVLDSLTHPASVFYEHAQKVGLRVFQRSLFLDDTAKTRDEVLNMLDASLAQARKDGQVIAIGHPRSATLAALAVWQGYKARDVNIVPLRVLNP